jgi:hypothetical protein
MASPTPFLCRLGLHRPDADPVWNRGYWFGRCRACGTDLVRTAAGKWHVPEGKKVVWKKRGKALPRPGRDERD